MGMRRVAVNDVVWVFSEESSESISRKKIDFPVHPQGEYRYADGSRCSGQRAVGLTYQMRIQLPIHKTLQQIQGLLFSAAPGSFRIDMQNVHLILSLF
jgi:hypothetical protein